MVDDPFKASINSFKYDYVKNHNEDVTDFYSKGGMKLKIKRLGDKYLPIIIVVGLVLLGAIPLFIKFIT